MYFPKKYGILKLFYIINNFRRFFMSYTNIPRPEHPTPIWERENWRNLNGEWLFEIDYGLSGEERTLYKPEKANEFTRKILVPFCPESTLSGIGVKEFMPAVWYKREIEISEKDLERKVILHFGASDYHTSVWLNGELVGDHFGGFSSFEFDVTTFLTVGTNDLTVEAKDDPRSEKQPLGKQSRTYYSKLWDYTRTTGIWQTVWLEFLPKKHIELTKVFPDIEACAFDIEVTLPCLGKLTIEAAYEGKSVGKVETMTRSMNPRIHLPLSEKHLWEAGHGRLYDLVYTFEAGGSVDTVKSYAGLREVTLDGFKFRLNGKSVFQRTVLDQGYYPDGIYTAPTEEALKFDIDLGLSLGFNGARPHQKIFEPRYLYHCDKAGYLVWGEFPSWGLRMREPSILRAFVPEWTETVARDFNHPSIIGWCPFNEVWESKDVKMSVLTLTTAYKLTKLLDPTRPVIDTSGHNHIITDIFDQHDYEQDPEIFRKSYENYDGSLGSFRMNNAEKQIYTPDLPMFLSEYGGIKWVSKANKNVTDGDWGYGEAPKTEEAFFARYEGLTAALLENPNVMGFCYTQLYDVEQEVNGLYTYERVAKFDDYSRIIAANKQKAAIED